MSMLSAILNDLEDELPQPGAADSIAHGSPERRSVILISKEVVWQR